ncbi:MAG: hypothetical protein EBV10_02670 [Synechococcaceae bacterium WB6_1A_059]|nr:hypothetical protein [Synechococcaceae bacterium WB6_1A_059]
MEDHNIFIVHSIVPDYYKDKEWINYTPLGAHLIYLNVFEYPRIDEYYQEVLPLVENIIIEHKIDYIFPIANERSNLIIAKMNQKFNLIGIKETHTNFLLKSIYYDKMESLNIPIPIKYKLTDEKKFPVIVKPSLGFASFGVKILYNEEEIKDWFRLDHPKIHPYQISVDGKHSHLEYAHQNCGYIIQEYIKSDLITIAGRVFFNKIYFDFVCDIISSPPPYCSEIRLQWPSKYGEEIFSKIFNDCRKFLKDIELNQSHFMFDVLIVNHNYYFIDFGMRLPANPQALIHACDIYYTKNWMNHLFNNKKYILQKKPNFFIINENFQLQKGVITNIEMTQEVDVFDYTLPKIGTKVFLPRNDLFLSFNGDVTVKEKSLQDADNKLNKFYSNLKITFDI